MGPFRRLEDKHGVDEPGYEPPTDEIAVESKVEPPADHMLRTGIVWAILIPFVGVILAIRLWARERVGQGFAVLATAILVVVVYLYAFGTFDRPLSSIGLNMHECARNGLGQTFCGKELTEARERQREATRESEESTAKIEQESKEAEAKAKRESEALEAKASKESEALEHRSEEEQISSEEQIRQEEKQLSE